MGENTVRVIKYTDRVNSTVMLIYTFSIVVVTGERYYGKEDPAHVQHERSGQPNRVGVSAEVRRNLAVLVVRPDKKQTSP